MKVGLVVLAVCGFLVTAAAAGAATPIVPSKTRAAYAVKVELADKYPGLVTIPATQKMKRPPANATVTCQPLTDKLYRCTYYGKDPVWYTVVGKAKVRFYKYATDVVMYDETCYNAGLYVDFCRQ